VASLKAAAVTAKIVPVDVTLRMRELAAANGKNKAAFFVAVRQG
jgi:hypothetical protein